MLSLATAASASPTPQENRQAFERDVEAMLQGYVSKDWAGNVAIVYAVYYVDQTQGPFATWLKTAIALAGIVLLALPAVWRERRS